MIEKIIEVLGVEPKVTKTAFYFEYLFPVPYTAITEEFRREIILAGYCVGGIENNLLISREVE